jgi:hypothetical protein
VETSKKTLTPIDQLALAAIVDHLEPHDCQWNLYGEAAQSVVDAVEVPIQIQAIRAWADSLQERLNKTGATVAEMTPQGLRARADELEAEHAQKKANKLAAQAELG